MIKIRSHLPDFQKKVRQMKEESQKVLEQQVLKDSNYYAPEDTGELIRSSVRESVIGSGKLVWNTAYARRLYYNPEYNFSKDRNPNARGLWFEFAKSNHLDEWKRMINVVKRQNF